MVIKGRYPFLIALGFASFLILVSFLGAIVLIIFGPVGLNLLGGSLLMLTILPALIALVGGGGAGALLAWFNAQEESVLKAERAQLEAVRSQLAGERAQAIAQLEAKKAQLAVEETQIEAKKTELDVREAKLAVRMEKEAKREAQLAAEAVEIDARIAEEKARYTQLIVEQRRVKAWEQQMEKEGAQLEGELAQLKTIYGENFPIEVSRNVMTTFFSAIKSEDPPLLGRMLSNPFGFTEAPKPIKTPKENKNHDLLEQALQTGIITQEDFDDVLCPIAHQVMQDPVKGEDGRTYDRPWLRPIYYQLSGTYPDLKLGTYPLTRKAMACNPDELPRDDACYKKIQDLVAQCQAQSALSEATEENELFIPRV